MTDKAQDETIKSRIIGLLQRGYTRAQLINDFSFAERTVDSAVKDYKEQGGTETEDSKKSEEFDPKALALPAKLDIKQVIVPEYLIKHLSFVDGGQRQTFIDALLVYEAARRSVTMTCPFQRIREWVRVWLSATSPTRTTIRQRLWC